MSDYKLQISPASILVEYITKTLGKMTIPDDRADWPLYESHMPDGENVKTNCGALYDTSGINEGKLMSGLVVPHLGIQLRIRASTSKIGWSKIEDIILALDEVNNVTIVVSENTYKIQNVSRTTPIVPLGLERGTRRYLFTANFLLTVRKLN